MLALETNGGWCPATVDVVKRIVQQDLIACTPEEVEAFGHYAIEYYEAPLVRYGKPEPVVVIARKDGEVMYWEDVEEGFNISPIGIGRKCFRAPLQSGHYCSSYPQVDLTNRRSVW
jgi:hypothetical protein